MPTFWDLPKNVRDIIYRHHLVYDKPITIEVHQKVLACPDPWYTHEGKLMPPIFHLSKKAEREATPFYYEANTFNLGGGDLWLFNRVTYPRHWNRVRKIECTWDTGDSPHSRYASVRPPFAVLGKMKKLEELSIRVDETKMVNQICPRRGVRQRPWSQDITIDLTAQQNIAILHFPGVVNLLSLTHVKHINFIKLVDAKGVETGGLIPGGPLEMHVLPRLKPVLKAKRHKKGSFFRFLDLPPEMRNNVYFLLMSVPGQIHPSKEPPTTATKNDKSPRPFERKDNESSLSILGVCKQMHEEAMGIYYHCNSFMFHYPVQLNAFLLAIGERKKMLRDITMYYHNTKLGGVDLIDLTLPLLQQLPGLKRLHIIMMAGPNDTGLRRGWYQPYGGGWTLSGMKLMDSQGANPARIPGMSTLFDLRGLTDLKVRDLQLEKKVEELKKHKAYPNFPNGGADWKAFRLAKAYEHFNAALMDAQLGQVNRKLLEDKQWQWWDVFPTMDSDGVEKEEKD